jgi:hypothetical protein
MCYLTIETTTNGSGYQAQTVIKEQKVTATCTESARGAAVNLAAKVFFGAKPGPADYDRIKVTEADENLYLARMKNRNELEPK